MRNLFFCLLVFNTQIANAQDTVVLKPVVPVSIIEKSIESWSNYERDYMVWSADYIAMDTGFTQIGKKEFLKELITGKYLPVRLKTNDSTICYQLYKLNRSTEDELSIVIKYKALVELKYFNMEGLPLPGYNFIDLEKNIYNRQTTKGKIVMIKCWFINCIPCIQEMPRLNALVSEYKNREDVVFIGLAFDKEVSLKSFLQKTTFNYRIVPDKEDYLLTKLGISSYPTHLILNKNGLVLKVSENLEEIISVLKNELLK